MINITRLGYKLAAIQLFAWITFISFTTDSSHAGTPITLFQSYTGKVNFIGTESTRRTQANGINLPVNTALYVIDISGTDTEPIILVVCFSCK